MARGSFLIKGGKGKIGLGERQIGPEEIIPMYFDSSQELSEIKREIQRILTITNNNSAKLYYDRVPVLVVDKEEFSNATYFNPNPYIILKNANDEFFFGIDSSKPNSRFDPRGTIIKLDNGNTNTRYSVSSLPAFYCLADEKAVYQNSSVTFYKIYPTSTRFISYNYALTLFYNFTIIREDLPNNKPDSIDLKIMSVPPSTSVTADEIRAEVKNGILYFTVKNARHSESVTSFVVCQLPSSYRPSREINVSLFNSLGETFFGTLAANGELTVVVNNKSEGVYLHTSVPAFDSRYII